MHEFTPVSGVVGGLMIGTAASLFILFEGRIAGISGILGGALSSLGKEGYWRIAFLLGLVLGPLLIAGAGFSRPEIVIDASVPVLIVAGLLVGFGTRLGNGCTSGHGVCGVARASPRSVAATITFFAVATVTVFATRHVLGG